MKSLWWYDFLELIYKWIQYIQNDNDIKLYEGIHQTADKANEPYDITNGLSVIRVYSSINAQTFGLNSPLIDNLIHVSMGLNNMITWDNLSIDVIEQPNLAYIDWMLTDANDKPISLNSNVYISFTISCYAK